MKAVTVADAKEPSPRSAAAAKTSAKVINGPSFTVTLIPSYMYPFICHSRGQNAAKVIHGPLLLHFIIFNAVIKLLPLYMNLPIFTH